MDDFTATTEAELRLYNPQITDFMITEDDGGTQTEWSCKAKVFVAGKSYGVEVSFPMSVRDDIVWRGKLTRKSLDRFDNMVSPLGDVELTFEQIEY